MEVEENSQVSRSWKGAVDLVDEMLLMDTPYTILAILTSYTLFVLLIGPLYMKNRKPYELTNVIFIYNCIQVAFSAWSLQYGVRLISNFGVIYSECNFDKKTMATLAAGIHMFLLIKITELLDTVFFVLRKKHNQVSFLHVYHHLLVVTSSWLALKYEPSFVYIFLGTVNCLVHVVMYTYYGLSLFPSLAPYLWWKKYITSLQLAQFVVVFFQITTNYFYIGCKPSTFLMSAITINIILLIYLFSDFYSKTYKKDKVKKEKSKINETHTLKIGNSQTKDVKRLKSHGQ